MFSVFTDHNLIVFLNLMDSGVAIPWDWKHIKYRYLSVVIIFKLCRTNTHLGFGCVSLRFHRYLNIHTVDCDKTI